MNLNQLDLNVTSCKFRLQVLGGYLKMGVLIVSSVQTDSVDVVTDIFREELKLPDIGPDDNFFDLGGDSLMAEMVILGVQKAFDVKLATAALMKAPSPRELASYALSIKARPDFSRLVTAVQGCSGSEPVAMVHGMSGSPLFASRFGSKFKAASRIFVMRGMGRETGEDPFQTREDLATAYLAGVRDASGREPRIYGGICVGGLVAMEMARLHHARTGERCKIILIDPPAPGSKTLSPVRDRKMTSGNIRKLERQANFWRRSRDLLDRFGAGMTVVGRKARRETFKKKLTSVMAGYEPAPFPCDVLLVASSEWGRETLAAYKNWCPPIASVQAITIPGDHKGFQHVNRDMIDKVICDFISEHVAVAA